MRAFEADGGIALFVNADRPTEGMTLLDINFTVEHPAHHIGSPMVTHLEAAAEQEQDAAPAEPWHARFVPEQVQLVDLLQFLQLPPFVRRGRRLVVIISAWDVVSPATLSPADWLSREMPLLDQFLRNNPESFEVRVYGVSAQGGDLKSAAKADLLKLPRPSLRIRCVGPDVSAHDLTAPLVWLSGGD
jgi:hypothetical protein